MNYPSILKNLIECYKKLPGVGEKSAERMALATIDIDQDTLAVFSDSILNLKDKLKRCVKCNNYCEDELCQICLSDRLSPQGNHLHGLRSFHWTGNPELQF